MDRVAALLRSGATRVRANRLCKTPATAAGTPRCAMTDGNDVARLARLARLRPDPLGFEIRRMLRESTLGMSAEQALAALGERLQSSDLDMVLTAINVQRAVGGNLAEILDKVAHTMRERERIRGEISTLTAQQKMTGIVIGGLPIFMFGIFMLLNCLGPARFFPATADWPSSWASREAWCASRISSLASGSMGWSQMRKGGTRRCSDRAPLQ